MSTTLLQSTQKIRGFQHRRGDFKRIGIPLLITRLLVRQSRFDALIPAFFTRSSRESVGCNYSTEFSTSGGSALTSWMTHSRLSRRLWITLGFRRIRAIVLIKNDGTSVTSLNHQIIPAQSSVTSPINSGEDAQNLCPCFQRFCSFCGLHGWRKNDPVDRAICTGNPTSFVFPLFQPSLFNLNFLTLNLYPDGMPRL